MSVDAKIMTVVGAIKQSLQMSGGPGSSVNSHPNPFFLNVTGEMNLKHMAELVIQRVEEYEAALKVKIEKELKAIEAEQAKLRSEVAKTVTDAKAELL
jgi:hypothetical protein